MTISVRFSKILEREADAKPSAHELWREHFKGWSSGEADRSVRDEEILRADFDIYRLANRRRLIDIFPRG